MIESEQRNTIGPQRDGTYIVEFRIAAGETMAISIPGADAAVIHHFQERIPYDLVVPDVRRTRIVRHQSRNDLLNGARLGGIGPTRFYLIGN
jgi:hypothetical protein